MQTERELARVREQVELLAGQRGNKQKTQSAVRRGELIALASNGMQSQQLTGAPTMADYNALQADVAAIYQALELISNRLGNATVPSL